MKVIILAGGEGVRLRPLTFAIPKPLIPAGERPILEIIIKRLKKFGFRNFIFSVGYKAHLIEAYFQDGKEFGIKIAHLHEDKPLGTAGGLKVIAKRCKINRHSSFLLMNGDILTRLNFKNLVEFHKQHNADLTMGVKKFSQKLPFGVLRINKSQVKSIKEKPENSYDVSAGIYVIKTSALDYLPRDRACSMPELITKLIKDNKKVVSYMIKEDWLAIEHLQHIEEVNYDLERWVKE